MKGLFKQLAFPLAFSLALVCTGCHSAPSPSSSPSASSRAGAYLFCYTTSPAHGITVSSVFHVPQADQVTMLEEPWAKDFRRYVAQSGDAGAISVSCQQVDPQDPDGAVKDKIDTWKKQGIQVKQVNWKYAG